MLRVALATFATLFLALAAVPAFADDAGKIVSMEGTVEIGRRGAFTLATIGGAIVSGDTIRTGTPGRARVLFVDDSVLNLGDATTLLVDETVFDSSRGAASTMLRLLGGKVRALVSEYYSKGQGSYTIETTTAVSGVRGTEFIVAFDAKTEFSQVLGLGGSVAVHSPMDRKNRGVLIHANEITDVAKGKYPTPPRQISSDDDTYRQLMSGLDLPGRGLAESLLNDDPAFGGVAVPSPDTADGNVVAPAGEDAAGTTTGGGSEIGGSGSGATGNPITDLPPDAPARTGGDLLGQPQDVVASPTEVEIEF